VAVKIHEWTSVDVQTPIFLMFLAFLERQWTSVEVLESGEMVGRGRFGLFRQFLCA
jgi:hypothetical protein